MNRILASIGIMGIGFLIGYLAHSSSKPTTLVQEAEYDGKPLCESSTDEESFRKPASITSLDTRTTPELQSAAFDVHGESAFSVSVDCEDDSQTEVCIAVLSRELERNKAFALPKLRDLCLRKDKLTACYIAKESGEQDDSDLLQLAFHRRCDKLQGSAFTSDVRSEENSTAMHYCLEEASIAIEQDREYGLSLVTMHCVNGWTTACFRYLALFNRSEVSLSDLMDTLWGYCGNRNASETELANFCDAYSVPDRLHWETALNARSPIRNADSDSVDGFASYRKFFAVFQETSN